jgi:hypothetical protein
MPRPTTGTHNLATPIWHTLSAGRDPTSCWAISSPASICAASKPTCHRSAAPRERHSRRLGGGRANSASGMTTGPFRSRSCSGGPRRIIGPRMTLNGSAARATPYQRAQPGEHGMRQWPSMARRSKIGLIAAHDSGPEGGGRAERALDPPQ